VLHGKMHLQILDFEQAHICRVSKIETSSGKAPD
jgi:hypothetical protein